MKVKVINKSKHELPHYSTIASAGMDLRANIEESINLKPLERTIVKTGIFMELPVGYEAQVRRSYLCKILRICALLLRGSSHLCICWR